MTHLGQPSAESGALAAAATGSGRRHPAWPPLISALPFLLPPLDTSHSLDIDWEYPGDLSRGGTVNDKANLAAFCRGGLPRRSQTAGPLEQLQSCLLFAQPSTSCNQGKREACRASSAQSCPGNAADCSPCHLSQRSHAPCLPLLLPQNSRPRRRDKGRTTCSRWRPGRAPAAGRVRLLLRCQAACLKGSWRQAAAAGKPLRLSAPTRQCCALIPGCAGPPKQAWTFPPWGCPWTGS